MASKTTLQWRPTRNGSSKKSSPVRTVRYEEDVFDDGPALERKASLAAVPLDAGRNQPPIPSPFDEPATPPTPMPEPQPQPQPTPPTETTPMPAPAEATPPLEFRPPATREPSLIPSPDPLGRPSVPEPTTPPDTLQPSRPSPFPGFDFPLREPATRDPAQDCEAAYNKLRQNTIDKLSINIAVSGQPGNEIPFECTLGDDPFDARCWKMTTYTWKASALCHKPIYFEDVALERYGHSHGPVCEYLASFAHFFGNVALLPYNMGVKTPCECEYTLGYYRPGSCAPYMLDPFPISLRGAAFGAVGYCGTIALFP